jgi:uncharacterized protein
MFRVLKRFLRRALVVALGLCALGRAYAVDVPALSGHVNDLAHMLGAPAAAELETKLAAYEKATSSQLALLTIPSLEGESLEQFSLRVAEAWKLGKKGVDNGALMLVVRDDKKIRIEVGYGLEASLTDAVTSFIIRQKITPRFKEGNFAGGIAAGFEALIQAADGKLDMKEETEKAKKQGLPWILFGIFLVIGYGFIGLLTYYGLFMTGGGTVMLYILLLGGYGIAGSVLHNHGTGIGYILFFVFMLGFPIAKIILSKTEFGKKKIKKMEASTKSVGGRTYTLRSSSGWSSHSSFSSSSSHFSGGGGRFGGGGASGSW